MYCSSTHPHRGRYAFSLIEVMVVLVIIAMAATLVTINVRGAMNRARGDAARAEISTLAKAVEEFHLVHSRYPTAEEGLEALTRQTDRLPEPLIEGGLAPDPWGNAYEYVHPGLSAVFEIISYGADGQEGGTGADADIISSDVRGRYESR